MTITLTPACYDTVEAIHTPTRPRAAGTQSWSIGDAVNVGFVRGLLVIAADAQGFTLRRADTLYSFRPHCGLQVVGSVN